MTKAAIVVATKRQELSLAQLEQLSQALPSLGREEDPEPPGAMMTKTTMVVAADRREDRGRVCGLREGPWTVHLGETN